MTLFESIYGADGSPRMLVTIQFTTSSMARDRTSDSDAGHGEQARAIAGKCGRRIAHRLDALKPRANAISEPDCRARLQSDCVNPRRQISSRAAIR